MRKRFSAPEQFTALRIGVGSVLGGGDGARPGRDGPVG